VEVNLKKRVPKAMEIATIYHSEKNQGHEEGAKPKYIMPYD
jgi:hypothetical protein